MFKWVESIYSDSSDVNFPNKSKLLYSGFGAPKKPPDIDRDFKLVSSVSSSCRYLSLQLRVPSNS